MSLYKPKNSPFWHYDFRRAGRRFNGTTGERDRRRAERIEAERKRAALALAAVAREQAGKPLTWAAAAVRWQAEVGDYYAKTLWPCLEWLTAQIGAGTPLAEIDGERVARIVARRRGETAAGRKGRRVSAATVNRTALEPLRRVLRRAERAWGCAVARIDWTEHRLDEPPERIAEMTTATETRVLAAERDDYAPALRFAILSGCRMAEIVGLTWDDVDFGERQFRVLGKGDKMRLIPITPDLRTLLWSLRGHHDAAVFTYVARKTRDGRRKGQRYPITYSGLKSRWRRTKTTAGVKEVFHDMRHTFATRTLRGSRNLKAVSKALGHADLKTTSRYAHVLMDDLREAMASSVARSGAETPEQSAEAAPADQVNMLGSQEKSA